MEELSLESILSNLTYYINDAVIITDAGPIEEHGPLILFVNPTFTHVTGYHASEVIGKSPRLMQGPGTSPGTLQDIRTALASWRPITAELLNYKKDGSPFWNEISIVPAVDNKGINKYWISIQRDTTDLRQQQHDLNIRSLAMDASTFAIAVCKMDGDDFTVVYGNKPFTTLVQTSADDQGDAFLTMMGASRQTFISAVHDALDGGRDYVFEEPVSTPAGDSIFARIAVMPVTPELYGANLLLLTLRDITREQAQKEETAEAQRLRAIGHLTGGVAHDFNNLLTIVLHCSEILLAKDTLDADARDLIETIAQTADRGAALTSKLLSFARRRPLETTSIQIRPFLERFEYVLRRLIPSTIDVQFEIAANLANLRADPAQLDTALLNLVINARDAISTRGVIRLVAVNKILGAETSVYRNISPGAYVSLTVMDDGPGMSDEVVSRAFEPFFTTKDVGQGSGLGLSMVYGFALQSDGCASIASSVGHGTAVEILLPQSDDPMGYGEPLRGAGAGLTLDSVTVLVVEDTPDVLKQVDQLVRGMGCRTYVASNGQEALEVLKAHQDIDLLFTDVVMGGGLSGVQLAKDSRALRPDLKVLFTSGYSEENPDVMNALSDGAPILKKPYRRAELSQALSRVLQPRA